MRVVCIWFMVACFTFLFSFKCCAASAWWQTTLVKPVVKPVWQPFWQTAVSCIQPVVEPVVQPVWQPVWQPVVSCKQGIRQTLAYSSQSYVRTLYLDGHFYRILRLTIRL